MTSKLSFLITLLAALGFCSGPLLASQMQAVPEPLTLEYALAQAESTHSPDIMAYQAQKQMASAEHDLALSEQGFYVSINGRLRYVDPSPALPNQTHNDNKISLDISKRLYDFGRTEALLNASKKEIDAVDALYLDYKSERLIAILQSFLNVLLADLIYDKSMEAMAVAYVAFDKAQSRREVGKLSDFELLKIENRYRKARQEQSQAQNNQRITRLRLAQLINNNGNLPGSLELPDLSSYPQLSPKRELSELQVLQQQALENNPELVSLKHKLAAAGFLVESREAEKYPIIRGELQAADYGRELGSHDRFRAGILLSVPLYQAGQEDARIKLSRGKLKKLEAEYALQKQQTEQYVLELWFKLQDLKSQLSDADLQLDYRDLYLDRSRGLYEMEFATDLGDAMVQLSDAQLSKAQIVFSLAVAWAKLDALTGNPMNYITAGDH